MPELSQIVAMRKHAKHDSESELVLVLKQSGSRKFLREKWGEMEAQPLGPKEENKDRAKSRREKAKQDSPSQTPKLSYKPHLRNT